jgi:hypothetical protein
MTKSIEVGTVRRWLAEGGEIASLDVREEGQHGAGHPLLATNIPYSRLGREIARLVPRRSCRIVLVDDAGSPRSRPDASRGSATDAMRAYLRWETELPGQIAADGLTGFSLVGIGPAAP